MNTSRCYFPKVGQRSLGHVLVETWRWGAVSEVELVSAISETKGGREGKGRGKGKERK